MKSGNREVNIFNMSLLDILCGALGAFCFMMLALFPYYKPNLNQNLGSNQAAADPKSLAEAEAEIRAARAQIQNLQSMAAALQGNNGQMQAQIAAIQQQNQILALRRPIVETTLWRMAPGGHAETVKGVDARVSTWLVDVHPPLKDRQRIVFNPSLPGKTFWNGDLSFLYGDTPGATAYLVRDRPPNYDYDVYVDLFSLQGLQGDVLVRLNLQDAMKVDQGLFEHTPWFVLNEQTRFIKAGTLHVDQNDKATFQASADLKRQVIAAGEANPADIRQQWSD